MRLGGRAHGAARDASLSGTPRAGGGNLALPLALAGRQGNKGRYWATKLWVHAQTNARVIEQCMPVRFTTQGSDGGVLVGVDDHTCY